MAKLEAVAVIAVVGVLAYVVLKIKPAVDTVTNTFSSIEKVISGTTETVTEYNDRASKAVDTVTNTNPFVIPTYEQARDPFYAVGAVLGSTPAMGTKHLWDMGVIQKGFMDTWNTIPVVAGYNFIQSRFGVSPAESRMFTPNNPTKFTPRTGGSGSTTINLKMKKPSELTGSNLNKTIQKIKGEKKDPVYVSTGRLKK